MASYQKRGENSWLLVVESGYDAKGKRKKRTKTIRVEDKALLKTTKKLRDYLESELHRFKIEVEAGEYIKPEKMTLDTFIKDWELKYAIKELGETTLGSYLSLIKNHIAPAMGHMRLEQVQPVHIIDMIDNMKRIKDDKKPLSDRTKQDVYLAIRNIFERAKEWKLIAENPVENVKKPRIKTEKKADVYSEDEVEILFKVLEKEAMHWKVFATLALAAGLRRGENLGLEWKHIDLEKGTLEIEQTIVKGLNGPIIKGPKTKRSKRIISLPASVVEELKIYHFHWLNERSKMDDRWIEEDHKWLFCNEDGTHFYPTTPTTWWARFTEKAKVRFIRLHDLRHTSATLLINQGVHAKIISERLGHSDIRVTMNTYGHALRKADQEAANKLDGLFSRKQAK